MFFNRSSLHVSARNTAKRISRAASGLLLVLAFTLPASAVDLLYVSLGNDIATFDVSSGNTTTIANSKTIFASGLNAPQGLAFDSSNNLYVANRGDSTIQKITPAASVTTFASNTILSWPFGLAFDSSGNLYAANYTGNSISKIDSTGDVTGFATGMNNPIGLAFDSSGNLYVANNNNSTISKITPGGAVTLSFASVGLSTPLGLTIDSSGNLYASNYGTNAVSKIDSTGNVTGFATGLNNPRGLTIDSGGNLFVANVDGNSISKIDTTGNIVYTFSTGSASPAFLAFGPGTPVPEPSTYALAAIAAGVMGVIARRRKARQS